MDESSVLNYMDSWTGHSLGCICGGVCTYHFVKKPMLNALPSLSPLTLSLTCSLFLYPFLSAMSMRSEQMNKDGA